MSDHEAQSPDEGSKSLDPREQRRVAENEIRYRTINEKIEAAISSAGMADHAGTQFDLLCECAKADCREMLQITLPEYEEVRSEGDSS